MPAPPPVRRRPSAAARTPAAPRVREDGRRRYRMSRAEYEAFQEAQTDAKFEWVDGEAIEMAGGTEEHADVIGNLDFLLRTVMRRRRGGTIRGKVYNSELRVRTRDGTGPNRYADASVVLGQSRFARHPEDKKLDLLNPHGPDRGPQRRHRRGGRVRPQVRGLRGHAVRHGLRPSPTAARCASCTAPAPARTRTGPRPS